MLLACCLASLAAAGEDFRHAAGPAIKLLDGCRRDLKKIENRIAESMDDNLAPPQQFTLHELVFFCRTGALELHDIVDVFLMQTTPGTGEAFHKQKRRELAERASFGLWSMAKRAEYMRLEAKGPYAEPERWERVRRYALEMEKVFQRAREGLKRLQTVLKTTKD
jgi:hypothetical protein